MKLAVLCALLLTILGCQTSLMQTMRHEEPQIARDGHEWSAARYRGLILGTSTRADLLRVFGKPNWSELFDEDKSRPEVWYHYKDSGELPGEMVVNLDKHNDTILRLYLHPENLSRDEAIRHFGDGYVVTRYEFCKGFEEAESAPLYETQDGQFVYIEYRERGIAVAVDNDSKVTQIAFVSEPIGVPLTKCKQF